MSERVAVIGAGAAGIAAAYTLRDDAELTIFEREDRPGGHANTVAVEDDVGIDTGFIVFNARTYPQLSAFFDELGVAAIDHRGGFNFFDLDTGLQYGTPELDLKREDVERRYPPEFQQIWREARRFHRRAPRDYVRGLTNVPLGEYLDTHHYSDAFKHSYVILLGSAVWSIPEELIWEMPASTVIGFFMSHDTGGLGGREIAWKTVAGGSRNYVRRALEAIDGRLELGSLVTGVREMPDRVEVSTREGTATFDHVIVATHADEALALVENAPDVLSTVRYNPAVAVVHRDPSVLPPDRERWQSWNYGRSGDSTYVVWWMNKLQSLKTENDYFLTLDCPLPLENVVAEIPYTHPVISVEVRELQQRIYDINERGRIKYCGSYFHSPALGPDLIASHEAAHSSGVEAASAVKRALPAFEGDRSGSPAVTS